MAKENPKKNTFFKLELVVLASIYSEDRYGYEITATIQDYTNDMFKLRQGVLYPILYKLVEEGYVSSSNRVVRGRNRVYYHLEPKGRELLLELMDSYHKGTETIDQFLAKMTALDQAAVSAA